MRDSHEYGRYQSSSSSSASYHPLSSSSQSQGGYYAAPSRPGYEEVDDHRDPAFNIEATPVHRQYMASTPVSYDMGQTPMRTCDLDQEYTSESIAESPLGGCSEYSYSGFGF